MNQQVRDELPGAFLMSLLFGLIAWVFAAHDKLHWAWSPSVSVTVFTLVCLNARR